MAHFFFQQTNQAAGRADGTPTTTQPAAPPTSTAPAPAAEPRSPFDPTMIVLLLAPILLVFWMTRSQTKKQKDLETSLKPGDRVVTRAGMVGKIIELGDRYIKLEIAPGVNVQVVKSGIDGKETPDPKAAEAAKAKESPKEKPQEKKA